MAARTPLTFTDTDRADLAHDRYHHPCPRVQQRMEVLWLVSQGETQRHAAALAGVSHATAERYIATYRREGVAGLRASRWVKPTSALRPHADALAAEFRDRPPHTLAEAADRIATLTGVRRKESAVRVFLKKVSA